MLLREELQHFNTKDNYLNNKKRINKMNLKKKAGLMETTLGKVVIGVALLLVLIGLALLFSGKLGTVWDKFARALRFG